MLIKNTVAKIIILKAFGPKNDNLFCKPGLNEFDGKSIEPYVKGNPAAQGYFDEGDLVLIAEVDRSAEKKKAAAASAKKATKEKAEAKAAQEKAAKEKAEALEVAEIAVEDAQKVFDDSKANDGTADEQNAALTALSEAQEALAELKED